MKTKHLLILSLVTACHTPPQALQPPLRTGAVQFFINWPQPLKIQDIPNTAVAIQVRITNSGRLLTETVSVNRPKTVVNIEKIPVGDNRIVEAEALDADNQIVAQGKSKPITIRENIVEDVPVTLTPITIPPPPKKPTTDDVDSGIVVEQQPGTLSGGVRNAVTGQPIGGATVRLSGSATVPVTTISTGVYTTNQLPPGNFTATASAPNYQSQSMTVTIDGNKSQNFELMPDPITPPPPTVTIAVTAPSSGQTLTKGTNYSVTWNANVSGNVKLKLWKGNSEVATLGANEPNDGHIPFNLEPWWSDGADYRIQIMDLSSTVASYSGYFTIASPSVVQLPAPTGVAATYIPGNLWNYITWNDVPGATGYKLYWGTSSNVTTSSQALTPTTTLDYGHSGVQPGFTYYYRVVALNGNAESPNLSGVVSATVPASTTCPAIPTGVSVSYNAGQSGNYLTWSAVSGAMGYKVYWGTSNSVTTSSNYYGSTSSTAALHTGVSSGFTYYYRVLATGSCDSGLSGTVSVTVPQIYNPTVSVTSSANASVPVLRRGTGHSFTQNGYGLPPNSTVTYWFQYPDSSMQTLNKTTDGSGFVSNTWTPNGSAMTGTYYMWIRYTANGQTLDTSSVSYRVDP